MRWMDFGSMRFSGCRFRTSPAKVTLHSGVGVNSVMGPIPDLPSMRAFQNSGTVLPTSVTVPSPVMTTRRSVIVRMAGLGPWKECAPTRDGAGAQFRSAGATQTQIKGHFCPLACIWS